jgi:hypothetical protein
MHEAGVILVGGHSIEDPEPKYGLSVTGTIHPAKVVLKGEKVRITYNGRAIFEGTVRAGAGGVEATVNVYRTGDRQLVVQPTTAGQCYELAEVFRLIAVALEAQERIANGNPTTNGKKD